MMCIGLLTFLVVMVTGGHSRSLYHNLGKKKSADTESEDETNNQQLIYKSPTNWTSEQKKAYDDDIRSNKTFQMNFSSSAVPWFSKHKIKKRYLDPDIDIDLENAMRQLDNFNRNFELQHRHDKSFTTRFSHSNNQRTNIHVYQDSSATNQQSSGFELGKQMDRGQSPHVVMLVNNDQSARMHPQNSDVHVVHVLSSNNGDSSDQGSNGEDNINIVIHRDPLTEHSEENDLPDGVQMVHDGYDNSGQTKEPMGVIVTHERDKGEHRSITGTVQGNPPAGYDAETFNDFEYDGDDDNDDDGNGDDNDDYLKSLLSAVKEEENFERANSAMQTVLENIELGTDQSDEQTLQDNSVVSNILSALQKQTSKLHQQIKE